MSELARIELLLDAGRYTDALGLLAPALAASPQDVVLWSHAARAHLGESQWAAALDCAGRVVALLPDQGIGHFFASIALAGQDRDQEALNAALEATRLTPLLPAFHLQVAECASLARGRRELAWQAANRAVELAPHDSESHAGMGLVALRIGRRDVAEQALLQALALDPSNHRAQHNLGLVRMQDGDIGGAARDLHRSAIADPGSDLSHKAFHILVLRCLQRVHWGLWGAWLVSRTVATIDPRPGPSGVLIGVLAISAGVLAWWLSRTLRGVDAKLRRVLWQVLRRSATATGWFVCVVIGIAMLVAAAVVPSPQLRTECISFAGWALLIGCLVSWAEVGLNRRRRS